MTRLLGRAGAIAWIAAYLVTLQALAEPQRAECRLVTAGRCVVMR